MSTTSTSTTNTTTQREPFEPVSDESRAVARAILSTLSPGAAACVLAAVAGLARVIVDAAALVQLGAMGEGLARTAVEAAIDAFGELSDDSHDASPAASALAAAWWYSTPAEVARAFWRDDIAREHTVAQSRGAILEAERLRAELASGAFTSTAAPVVVRLPMPAAPVEGGGVCALDALRSAASVALEQDGRPDGAKIYRAVCLCLCGGKEPASAYYLLALALAETGAALCTDNFGTERPNPRDVEVARMAFEAAAMVSRLWHEAAERAWKAGDVEAA